MHKKNGVPSETRDAATAEAVWGAPGLESRDRLNTENRLTIR